MNDHKGSAVMNQGQRMRYLKTGGAIAFILLVLYFVAPRDGLSSPAGRLRTHAGEDAC
jgi:guanosine-diphosphatase